MSRLIIGLLVLVSIPLFMTSCSADSKENAPSDVNKASIPEGWQKIQPKGISGTFALPQKIGSNAQDEVQTFAGGQGTETVIYVSVYSSGNAKMGENAADALAVFEKQRLTMQTTRLQEKGFTPEMKYEKELAVVNGLGQQIRMNLGDKYIFNQFLMTPDAFYHIKIDNADESNPVVQKFLKSFSVLN